VSEETGIARSTIGRGLKELASDDVAALRISRYRFSLQANAKTKEGRSYGGATDVSVTTSRMDRQNPRRCKSPCSLSRSSSV
jgi:hypothetical protein